MTGKLKYLELIEQTGESPMIVAGTISDAGLRNLVSEDMPVMTVDEFKTAKTKFLKRKIKI